MDKDIYFATLPPDEIGDSLLKKVEDYYDHLDQTGRMGLWKLAYEFYYQSWTSGGRLYNSGSQDEFTNMDVADFRNILQHLKVLTTNERPSFDAISANTDYSTQAETTLADSILDYYLTQKKLERNADGSTEHALIFGEGFVELEWDATEGDEFAIEQQEDEATGQVVRTGDLVATNYMPNNVIRDFTRRDHKKSDWVILRKFENRFELAAKFDTLKDEILGSSMDTRMRQSVLGRDIPEESDLVPVYTFYHRRCNAVPNGRIVQFVGTDSILTDGPLPYKNVPVYRMSPGEQEGTIFGWTVAYDLLPLQDALNKLYSIILTNQETFGVQNILVPEGHNMSVEEIVEGLNLMTYNPELGKPEPLNLTSTPAEIFKYIEMIEKKMETISGINSVNRGNPEASLKSGAALALVQSMSLQFNSGLQHSYAQLMEDMGTGIINILQDFANAERVTVLAGKSKGAMVKEWTSESLKNINRVSVQLGNPLSRTTAGKVEMATQLLQSGMITNPEQYLQVIQTGKIEPLVEGQQAELLAIKKENEALREGGLVKVVFTDNHVMHIKEHKAIGSDPEARKDPELMKGLLAHIQGHINELKSGDPALLQMLGQPSLAPPAQPQLPQAGGSDMPQGVAEGLDETLAPSQTGQDNLPNLPSMPTNPLTGEKFNLVDGGLG